MTTPVSDIVIGLLLVASGLVALIASLGLWRLTDFYLRMHAPALVATLAAWLVTLASIVHFSVTEATVSLHVWLIIILLAITAPVTAMLLARAALFRRRHVGDDLPPPLGSIEDEQARDASR